MASDAPEPTKPPRRYRGLDPEERRADRRRRLIEAGLELYGTIGYQATTITALCREAGITTQHFYDEFGSRENLLGAVFDETVMRAAVQVADALDGAPLDLEAQSRAGLGAFLHAMLDDPRGARILGLEVATCCATTPAWSPGRPRTSSSNKVA
jgi:AcrR family transcriptional regulator